MGTITFPVYSTEIKRMLASLVWFSKNILHHLIKKSPGNVKDENMYLPLILPKYDFGFFQDFSNPEDLKYSSWCHCY